TANRSWRPRVASLPSRPPPTRRNSQNASASRPSTTITNKTTLRPLCPSPNNASINPPRISRVRRLNGNRLSVLLAQREVRRPVICDGPQARPARSCRVPPTSVANQYGRGRNHNPSNERGQTRESQQHSGHG